MFENYKELKKSYEKLEKEEFVQKIVEHIPGFGPRIRAYEDLSFVGDWSTILALEIALRKEDISILSSLSFPLRRERKIKKVDRYSSKGLDEVKNNFFKSLLKGNSIFAKRYGKELLMRDANAFEELFISASLYFPGRVSGIALAIINLLPFTKDGEGVLSLGIDLICSIFPLHHLLDEVDLDPSYTPEVLISFLKKISENGGGSYEQFWNLFEEVEISSLNVDTLLTLKSISFMLKKGYDIRKGHVSAFLLNTFAKKSATISKTEGLILKDLLAFFQNRG